MGMEIQEIKKENNQLRRLVQKLLTTPQKQEQESDVFHNAPGKGTPTPSANVSGRRHH